MVLNNVNTDVDMAFAREEHRQWEVWRPARAPSDTRAACDTGQEGPGVVPCTMSRPTFPLKCKVKGLPLHTCRMRTILRGVQIALDSSPHRLVSKRGDEKDMH